MGVAYNVFLLWSNFHLLIFQVYQREFYERKKTPFTVCKYCISFGDVKFEKSAKYANEMTDDVIHSIQYYIKYIMYIIRAILANLQRRPLKLMHKRHYLQL